MLSAISAHDLVSKLTPAIKAGIASGDFPGDLDPELAVIASSAIFYQRLMTGSPFKPNRVSDLITLVLGEEN